ncbi:MAG: helix-turn-helix domain containing protein [Acidobacteriota bacterium]|jgi:AcrR family transcriptional regulator|nr:helix-turn-helix domain containing protein [Acidobacteriota bacterium]
MKKKDMISASILAAAETLFQKWGIRKTTMEDIAQEAGKAKSSLYYYFKDKEAVLEAVATAQAERIIRIVREEVEKKKTAREKLLTYVYTSFRETRRAITLYEIARGEMRATPGVLRKVIDKYHALEEEAVEEILRFGKKRKEFRIIGRHDISDTSQAIVTIMRSLIISLFIESDDKKTIDQIIALLSEGL